MTDRFETDDFDDQQFLPGRITYLKPTGSDEAHRLGLIPANIDLPEVPRLTSRARRRRARAPAPAPERPARAELHRPSGSASTTDGQALPARCMFAYHLAGGSLPMPNPVQSAFRTLAEGGVGLIAACNRCRRQTGANGSSSTARYTTIGS